MNYIKTYDDIRCFIKNDLCFFYGAGDIGKKLYDSCHKHGIHIKGFVISDGETKDTSMENVYYLSEVMQQFTICKIIVSTNRGLHKEIGRILEESSFPAENITFLYDMIDMISVDFHAEVERRSQLSLFAYKELAAPLSFGTRDHTDINHYYGNNYMIKKALNFSTECDVQGEIEHAPKTIDGLIIRYEVDPKNEFGDTIYVSSEYRKRFLQKYLPHKKIISVGIYMQYADRLLPDKEFMILKKELGRVLLVFPYHSTSGFSCDFHPDQLLEKIRKYENDFDSVLICMYWYDIYQHNERFFSDQGYQIVTAGHIYDYNFLPRLRTLIELSDITMSNAIGNHIAFCIYLNKPHYIVEEPCGGVFSSGERVENGEEYDQAISHLSMVQPDIQQRRRIERAFYSEFGEYRSEVTTRQIELVKRYMSDW